MDNIEYKYLLLELINGLRSKPEYMRSMSKNSPAFDQKFYEGMLLAYHFVMDEVIMLLQSYEVELDDFGLEGYSSNDILKIKPME